MTPTGNLTELAYHKGYFLDEKFDLFTHWRIVWAENETSGDRYIAKMVKTANYQYVEPVMKKRRGRTQLHYNLFRRKHPSSATRVDVLTEGRRGPRPIYLATHLDGDIQNCHPDNLDWRKLEEHQRIMRGEVVVKGKLTHRQKLRIKKRLAKGEMAANLAREYGVSQARISQLKKSFEK